MATVCLLLGRIWVKQIPNRTILVCFRGISGTLGRLAVDILAQLRLAKIRTIARPHSPDMPPKRTKKVRLGIKTLFQTIFIKDGPPEKWWPREMEHRNSRAATRAGRGRTTSRRQGKLRGYDAMHVFHLSMRAYVWVKRRSYSLKNIVIKVGNRSPEEQETETASTQRWRILKKAFSLWKRVECLPSTLRRRNLKTQQSPLILD